MTQKELSQLIGYKNLYSVQLLEKGAVDVLCITILMRIAHVFGMDWKDLV